MVSTPAAPSIPVDTPEARRYNRIKRWLGIADFVLGLAMLVILLVTGWSGTLRDVAYRTSSQIYVLAVFLYVVMLMLIAKVLSFGLDYYGFSLEHRFKLSNQKLGAWLWDETKGFLVSLVLASIAVEILYSIIRYAPQYWWAIAWAAFLGLFVLMAQLAPVILFPIFYKFEPLQDEQLKSRLVRLSEAAGTRVRGVYKWNLSEKSKKGNAALTGLGRTRRIILADTLLEQYSPDEIEAVLAHESGIMFTSTSSRASSCRLESPWQDSGRQIGSCTMLWTAGTALKRYRISPIFPCSCWFRPCCHSFCCLQSMPSRDTTNVRQTVTRSVLSPACNRSSRR